MTLIKERFDKLQATMAALDRPAPILIAQVDPDALGSAMALDALLKHLGHETGPIFYGGAIAHPQNRTIFNRFHLDRLMHPIRTWEPESEGPQPAFLVDSNSIDDNRLDLDFQIKPAIIIDHHRSKKLKEDERSMFWIEDVGAASTLAGELLLELAPEVLEEDPSLALLLAMGIYTDTKSLISSGARDQALYNQLSAYFSNHEMKQLIEYPLPEQYYQHLSYALQHLQRQGPRLIASLGHIEAEDSDDISTVCDYLVRMDGVSLALTWGLVEGDVRLSARSTNLGVPLDEFLSKRFGPQSGAKVSPDGRAEGGARIAFDMGFWMDDETEEAALSLISHKIQKAFFDSEKPNKNKEKKHPPPDPKV